MGKALIFCAPSGSGKTTIVHWLLSQRNDLAFSVSATSRERRGSEQNGVDYYFLNKDIFKEKIANDELVEWEEVYDGSLYGTLKEELQRIWDKGKTVVFDVDVQGGKNLKNKLGDDALAFFILPPSVEVLEARLRSRQTDDEESIQKRVNKAESELEYKNDLDLCVLNDNLSEAQSNVLKYVNNFLNNEGL
jgi:guanylate kinase